MFRSSIAVLCLCPIEPGEQASREFNFGENLITLEINGKVFLLQPSTINNLALSSRGERVKFEIIHREFQYVRHASRLMIIYLAPHIDNAEIPFMPISSSELNAESEVRAKYCGVWGKLICIVIDRVSIHFAAHVRSEEASLVFMIFPRFNK